MNYYNWWLARTRREQITLLAGTLFSVLMLGYLSIWQPLSELLQTKRAELQSSSQLLVWLQNAEIKISQARSTQVQTIQDDNQPLALVIEQALQKNADLHQQADLKQLEEAKMQITFNEVSFDELASWLRELQLHSMVSVVDFKVQTLNKPGLVKAELTVSQGK